MADATDVIASSRDAVCAVLGVTRVETKVNKLKYALRGATPAPVQIQLGFVGTAWCIVESRFLVTAWHVLNNGAPRDPADRFYVFSVPSNQNEAFHFPVIGFPFEDPVSDTAILEIGPSVEPGHTIPAIPVTFSRPPDGSSVVTIGYPSPAIADAQVNEQGEFLGGGHFFLKSHANTGIVAAQYDAGGKWSYEFNVGWHNGESGGPVIRLEPCPAVFSIMQQFRKIQTPIGLAAGPHIGVSLELIQTALLQAGATSV